MQTTQSKHERAIANKRANELAWFVQETIIRLQEGKASAQSIRKLAGYAKEALSQLRPLTGEDYRLVSDDLERLVQGYTVRGTHWDITINQMERILQETQNAPMAVREEVTV